MWGFLDKNKISLFKKSDFGQICRAPKIPSFCLVPKGIKPLNFYPVILGVLTIISPNFMILGDN